MSKEERCVKNVKIVEPGMGKSTYKELLKQSKFGSLNFVDPNVIVVEESDKDIFETKVNKYLLEGYKILSTNCGFIDDDQYNYCSVLQAILYK